MALMETERDQYKQWYTEECHKSAHLSARIAGLKGYINRLKKQTDALNSIMEHVAIQLYEIYNTAVESTPPEIYGAILGCHEILDSTLKGETLDLNLQRRDT